MPGFSESPIDADHPPGRNARAFGEPVGLLREPGHPNQSYGSIQDAAGIGSRETPLRSDVSYGDSSLDKRQGGLLRMINCSARYGLTVLAIYYNARTTVGGNRGSTSSRLLYRYRLLP